MGASSAIPGVAIRRAVPRDAPRLREIAAASKAYWGYDRSRVDEWAQAMDFRQGSLGGKDVYVVETDGMAIAFAALVPRGAVCELDDLWVDPRWIRRGAGRMLFRVAAERAAELGAEAMEWEAEPNAHGFYEKMGGRHMRDRVSAWGRVNRVMAIALDRSSTQ